MRTAIPPFVVGFTKAPWNKDRLIGQKRPLKPREVWAIRVRLQLEKRRRDLAPDDRAVDEKLKPSASFWIRLAATPPSDQEYEKGLANILQQTGCTAKGAPYVLRELIKKDLKRRFKDGSPQPAFLAHAFLDEANCPGARGLSEEDKGRLRAIAKQAPPPAAPDTPRPRG